MSSNIIEKLAAISAKYPPGCRYSADNTKFRPFAINYCRSLGSIPHSIDRLWCTNHYRFRYRLVLCSNIHQMIQMWHCATAAVPDSELGHGRFWFSLASSGSAISWLRHGHWQGQHSGDCRGVHRYVGLNWISIILLKIKAEHSELGRKYLDLNLKLNIRLQDRNACGSENGWSWWPGWQSDGRADASWRWSWRGRYNFPDTCTPPLIEPRQRGS